MADTAYLVRFKGADQPPEVVIAEVIEVHGEHFVFLRSDGSLAALVRPGSQAVLSKARIKHYPA
jgi:hypothetical protein